MARSSTFEGINNRLDELYDDEKNVKSQMKSMNEHLENASTTEEKSNMAHTLGILNDRILLITKERLALLDLKKTEIEKGVDL